jgi:hypothetical protein
MKRSEMESSECEFSRERKMKRYSVYITGFVLLGTVGCTSLSEGQESLPEGDVVQERRVRLRADPGTDLRDQMDEQASEINRKRNIEEFNQNDPATTPNTLRPSRVPNAPVDSTRHNINTPVSPTVRPIPANQ